MRPFEDIFAIAAARKGGADALEARLARPAPIEALRATSDDRWLSAMARGLFEAGFNWSVIDAKWPGFEAAFEGFAVERVNFYHDGDLDRLLADAGIVRNRAKLAAVIANARFLAEIAATHGSFGAYVAAWPCADLVGLLDVLERRGARLGGLTGQRVLRRMGVDSLVLSPDVVARLIAEGVVTKPPSSRSDMAAVQAAFTQWAAQSGRSFTAISQTLAASIDA